MTEITRRTLMTAALAAPMVAGLTIGNAARALELKQAPVAKKGKITYLKDFAATAVAPRDVTIWEPDDALRNGPLPVIYVHDGEATFDPEASPYGSSWEMDLIMNMLAHQGVGPAIIVAISAKGDIRSREYNAPTVAAYLDDEMRDLWERSCEGENMTPAYFSFIINELKPYVDANFDTAPGRDTTYMIGASMGGMLPLEATLSYGDVFGGGIGMSAHLMLYGPALPFGAYPVDGAQRTEAAIRTALSETLPAPRGNRLYFQRGTLDLDSFYGGSHTAVAEALLRGGYVFGEDFKMVVDKGASHHDTFWKLRMPEALRFLLGT